MQVPSVSSSNPLYQPKPAAAPVQPVPASPAADGDCQMISSPAGPGTGTIPLVESPPPLGERVEETVQRLWGERNPGTQERVLANFKQELNQCWNEELPPTYIYSDRDLTEAMQSLQERIDKIQRRLDEGTPDCGGGMGEELEACVRTQQALHEALQLRYLF